MIIDISLPDKNGIELTREVLRLLPECKVLIVSMHAKIFYMTEALRIGALGYLVKESTSETLLKGLDAISKGGHFVDPSFSKQITEDFGEAGVSRLILPISVSQNGSRRLCGSWPKGIPRKKSPKGCSSAPRRWTITGPIS